jgi:peptidoglycan hydrolase CwlO-like protein
MTQLFIQTAQSVTGAVLTVVGLGLVAVFIGYITAWYYAKSVYTPVIKGLETEKADLLKQVASLKDDISKLNVKIENLNQNIVKLEKDISEKAKQIEAKDKQIAEKERELNDLKIPKK